MVETLNFIGESHNLGADSKEFMTTFGDEKLLAAYRIQAVGWVEAGEGYHISELRSGVAMMYACLEGHGEVLVDGRWQICKSNMVYITPIGQTKAYKSLPNVVWKNCWILAQTNEYFRVDKPVLIHSDAVRPLFCATEGLYYEHIRAGNAEAADAWLKQILFYTSVIAEQQSMKLPRLTLVWEQVRAELARPWSLAHLSKAAALSEESLRRVCLSETGYPPMEYVTRLRMTKAASLLVTHSYSLAEIAHSVGYTDPFAFSTAFKRVMGIPPAQFRRASRLP